MVSGAAAESVRTQHTRPGFLRCRTVPLVVAVAAGCAGSDTGARWTTTDSAGIEIVSSTGTPPRWDLDPEPLLQLGSMDAPGPMQFYRVVDVELLPDGGLVVANEGSEELRVFAADGAFLGSAGREGHGPDEFDGLAMVESYGDSLMTWDEGNQRISVRSLDGRLVRTFQLEWFDGILSPVDLLGGTGIAGQTGILARTARYMSQLRGTGFVVDTALVSVYAMDGALVDSLVRVPHNARAVMRVGDLQTTLGLPYTAHAAIAGTNRGFCHAFGVEPVIRCRDRAGLRRLIRLDLPHRPLTESDIDRFWSEALETTNERRRSALNRMRDAMPFPDAFPAFAQLVRDDDGRLWARRYRATADEQEDWLVLEDGRWIARVASPIGFRVMDVRGDRLAGVWQDSLDVEFVRVYRYRAK